MELGEKIKAERLAMGLSQRQLCGDMLTRNMLSQIENGSARPSMKTLGFLAERLGKPISYFLEAQAVTSPNEACIAAARDAFDKKDLQKMRGALDTFQEPDGVFFEERQLLEYLWHLEQARQAIEKDMLPYAVKLLWQAEKLEGIYITELLRYRARVLLGVAGEPVKLACDEDALLARARQAKDPMRQLEILGAAEDKSSKAWNLLQAEALFALWRYGEAADHFEKAPQTVQVWHSLEVCYRELGDFKRAYEYACKQRI